MTEPLTKGGVEETHKGVVARSGLLPMRMRHVQMTVTVPGGMRTQILKLTDVVIFRSFEIMIRNTMRRFLAIMIKIITIGVIGVSFLTMICP